MQQQKKTFMSNENNRFGTWIKDLAKLQRKKILGQQVNDAQGSYRLLIHNNVHCFGLLVRLETQAIN